MIKKKKKKQEWVDTLQYLHNLSSATCFHYSCYSYYSIIEKEQKIDEKVMNKFFANKIRNVIFSLNPLFKLFY